MSNKTVDSEEIKWPLRRELVELYLEGKLERPNGDFVAYHLNEERAKLGDKYLIWDHWENFVRGIELSKELDEKKWEILWGK